MGNQQYYSKYHILSFFEQISLLIYTFITSAIPQPSSSAEKKDKEPYLSCIKPAKVLFFFVFLQLPPATRPTESLLGRGTTKEDDLGEKEGP